MGELDRGVKNEQYKTLALRNAFKFLWRVYTQQLAHLPLKAMHGAGPDENLTHSLAHRWREWYREEQGKRIRKLEIMAQLLYNMVYLKGCLSHGYLSYEQKRQS